MRVGCDRIDISARDQADICFVVHRQGWDGLRFPEKMTMSMKININKQSQENKFC